MNHFIDYLGKETKMSNKQTVYCYNLHVNGIYGRKRKPQRDMFTLLKHSPSKISEAELLDLTNKKLTELKLKGSWSVQEREGAIENDNGIEIYSTKLILGQNSYLLRGEIA